MARPLNCNGCHKPKTQCNCGRKPIMNEGIIAKLEQALQTDFTLGEACRFAGISYDTYYDYAKKNPSFVERMRRAKDYVLVLAKKNVHSALTRDKVGDFSLKVLSKRQRKLYSEQVHQDVTSKGKEIGAVFDAETARKLLERYTNKE